MSTGMTRLLAKAASFFSKAGNNTEASRHYEDTQAHAAVMNGSSLYGWNLDPWKGYDGSYICCDYRFAPQCRQLVQIVMMGNPTFLDPKIWGSSQQGYASIFMANYVSVSGRSTSLCSGLCGVSLALGINHSELLGQTPLTRQTQRKAAPASPRRVTVQLVLVSGRRYYSKISDSFLG